MALRFHNTKHLFNRQVDRGFAVEDVKAVVKYADSKKKQRTGRRGGTISKFKKTVDGKTLVVVAEIKKAECWLMTAYHED